MNNEFGSKKHTLWTMSNNGKELLVRTSHSEQNAAKERGPVGVSVSTLLAIVLMATSGCQVLTYGGPNGEHFSRCSFGATTSISSLLVEANTNGLRRVELRGYTNDSTSALGTVTEAAVRAAIQGAR
jgi:hypothetical protein